MRVTTIVGKLSFILATFQGTTLNKIYTEKIVPFPDLGLTEIGSDKATQMVVDGEAMVYTGLGPFIRSENYPCQVTNVKPLK